MYQVDLNSDLGESFGRYTIGMDEKIIPLTILLNHHIYSAQIPVKLAINGFSAWIWQGFTSTITGHQKNVRGWGGGGGKSARINCFYWRQADLSS